ncbi:MAG: hypothetical protein WC284_17745 [Candidimonas sp.]
MKGICLLAQSPRVGSTAWCDFLMKSLPNHNYLGEIFNIYVTGKNNEETIEILKDKKNILIKVMPYQLEYKTWLWIKENFEFITLKRISLIDIICSDALAHKNKIWNKKSFKNSKWSNVEVQHHDIKFIISENTVKFETMILEIEPITNLSYMRIKSDFKKLPYKKEKLIKNYDSVPNMIHQYCESIKFDYKSYGYTVEPE